MAVKSGYKQTEVGVIPDEWGLNPLNGLVSISHGFPFASKYFVTYGPFRLATPGHFYEEGGFRDVGEKQKFYGGPVPSDYVLRGGDMVIAMTEQADGLLGSAALIPDVEDYLHNQRLGRVKAISSEVDLGYLYYVFNSASYRAKVRETAAGSKVKHTSPEKLLEIAVCLPRLSEQRAIATALNEVDALLGALERLIAKKHDLKQATMQQLLTGQTRLPGFHGQWEVKTVAELEKLKLVKLSRGKVISKKDIESTPGEFPIYSSSVHNEGLFGCYGEFMFNEELITWSVDGGGNFFHRPKHKFSVTNVCGFMRVDVSRISYRFFAAALQLLHSQKSFDYQSKAHPSVVRKEYEVPLPPLPEQTAISTILSDMDAELVALEQRLAKTRTLKQGMMQELLTGRTRLV